MAVGLVALLAGLHQRRALLTGGIVAVIGIIAYFSIQGVLDQVEPLLLVILAVSAIIVGLAVGYFVGGDDASRTCASARSSRS